MPRPEIAVGDALRTMGAELIRRYGLGVGVLLVVGLFVACGGGGSSTRSAQEAPGTPTPVPTATAVAVCSDSPQALCVVNGSGPALNTVINNALPGSTIYVAPGTYEPVTVSGRDHGPITVIGDELAAVIPNVAAGAVTITARGGGAALTLDGQSGFTFDGVTLRGASDAALRITNSVQTTLQNSRVTANSSDAIVVENSSNTVLFDNLIDTNGGAGIRALSTFDLVIFNNTVYAAQRSGIAIGTGLQPAETTLIENNILYTNSTVGIEVDAASVDVTEDYNLNGNCPQPPPPAPPCYTGLTPGEHDIYGNYHTADPLFVVPGRDFHLQVGQNTSISPALDAGDPFTPQQFVDVLYVRSTQTDLVRDTGIVDLGYHYPQSIVATPTAVPSRPPSGGGGRPAATPTHTPTRTPTRTPTP
jgi:hypothetical protein